MKSNMRIGIGYDVHPLKTGRKLVLGGIDIPFDKGPDGWSDADVLVHAVIDALLGAAALGDIGGHFPPGDPRYKDIYSLVLLEEVQEKLAVGGWEVINIDATVMAAEPKLGVYIRAMRENIGRTLNISVDRVNIKAGTGNGVGAIGRCEGIAAHAVAMIESGKDANI
jgi:2-C-methyl-D-erythritol 2,4-cyclodiphosphate synthase